MALEKFPQTFDIRDQSKPFFPHLFNTHANIYAPALPHLPPKADYCYKSMRIEKRRFFLRWYAENRDTPFSLREQLPRYCMADVELLAAGLVHYRQIFLEECGFEVLERCTTLAAAVMTHYRMNLMKPNTIGIASELSYERHDKQSTIARKFLQWMAQKENLEIQHANSPEGEKRLTPSIILDGFIKSNGGPGQRDKAVEVNG